MPRCLVIAEAGVNHNGDLRLALELCDAARAASADVVKFQTFKTELLVTEQAGTANYQRQAIGSDMGQMEMLKGLELSEDEFRELKRHCDSTGIRFMSTPDEPESLRFLLSLGVDTIKVGSGEVDDLPFLRLIGQAGLPVILSTGMSYLFEVQRACETLKEAGADQVMVLHCTSEYPCPPNEANLRAMLTMKDALGLPVGYSDHTVGITVPVAAVALGAVVIEKHLTLDKALSGPDHCASMEPREFAEMVAAIRSVETSLGSGDKAPTPSECETRLLVRKSVVAARDIRKGEIMHANDLALMRPGIGLPPCELEAPVGKAADRDFVRGEAIEISAEDGVAEAMRERRRC